MFTLAQTIACMASPGSEMHTWRWLTEESALGELINFDFKTSSQIALYRASSVLKDKYANIEGKLYKKLMHVCTCCEPLILIDLTNTYFEGEAKKVKKAARGRSKEKRSDCKLISLNISADGNGFIRKSMIYAGNISEPSTLKEVLIGVNAQKDSTVVFDAGIATAENLKWLVKNGHHYIVASRKKDRTFENDNHETIITSFKKKVKVYKTVNSDNTEATIHCFSEERKGKEIGITNRFIEKFEDGLTKISSKLNGGRVKNDVATISERIGRLKEKCRGAHRNFVISFVTNAAQCADGEEIAITGLTWEKSFLPNSIYTNPGVYSLRTDRVNICAVASWDIYMSLTGMESISRCLKTELNVRPIYHQIEDRVEGHIFIRLLAYQVINHIRLLLKRYGINDSWDILRTNLNGHKRITGLFSLTSGETLNKRRAANPTDYIARIYKYLDIDSNPGGIVKILSEPESDL
jgi:transposase